MNRTSSGDPLIRQTNINYKTMTALKLTALMAIAATSMAADIPLLHHVERRTQSGSTAAPITCSGDSDCTRNEFCGIDGQCYSWSCDNWFQLGTWTRLGNTSSFDNETLSCSSYNTGLQDNLHAIVFGCQGYGPGVDIPPEDGVSQVFNRKCEAETMLHTFECYELDPFTDFSLFVAQAQSAPPQNCTQYSPEEIADGAPMQQSYLYSVYLSEQIGNKGMAVATGPDWTASLNADTALLSMYAYVEEKPEITSGPTLNPSNTKAPSPDPTSAAFSTVLRLGALATFAAAAMIG